MEAQAARELPPAMQYLSVHSDSTAIYLRWSDPQLRLEGGNKGSRALLSPNRHIILEFYVNTYFLTSSGILCWGLCAAMRSSKKPWPRCSMTHIIMEPALNGLKCSSNARSGRRAWRDNAGRGAARASSSSSGSSHAVEYLQVWTGGNLCYAVQASQALLTSST